MKRTRRSSRKALHEVANRLASLLPDPNALVGALAVAAHGYVRATDDIDFISPADPKEIKTRLSRAGIATKIRRGSVLEGDVPSGVTGVAEGIPFEVLFPPVPIDWTRTVILPVEPDSRLRVVDLDALLRLKLRAGGPQDLIDVVHLVRRHPQTAERAVTLADAYGVRERFEEWLNDPRVRSAGPAAPGRRSGGRSRHPSKRRK